MNKKHFFSFIIKNISCVQFSSYHTSDEIFSVEFFPNYGTYQQNMIKILFCPCAGMVWSLYHVHKVTGSNVYGGLYARSRRPASIQPDVG